MDTFIASVKNRFFSYKKSGVLHMFYVLLLEFLFIGYLIFGALFTLEVLLPTFITARVNFVLFFSLLLSFSFVLTFLGQILDVHFSWNINKKNPLVWIGVLWMIGIFTLSLLKFPPLVIPVILLILFCIGFLLWKIFFYEEKTIF